MKILSLSAPDPTGPNTIATFFAERNDGDLATLGVERFPGRGVEASKLVRARRLELQRVADAALGERKP